MDVWQRAEEHRRRLFTSYRRILSARNLSNSEPTNVIPRSNDSGRIRVTFGNRGQRPLSGLRNDNSISELEVNSQEEQQVRQSGQSTSSQDEQRVPQSGQSTSSQYDQRVPQSGQSTSSQYDQRVPQSGQSTSSQYDQRVPQSGQSTSSQDEQRVPQSEQSTSVANGTIGDLTQAEHLNHRRRSPTSATSSGVASSKAQVQPLEFLLPPDTEVNPNSLIRAGVMSGYPRLYRHPDVPLYQYCLSTFRPHELTFRLVCSVLYQYDYVRNKDLIERTLAGHSLLIHGIPADCPEEDLWLAVFFFIEEHFAIQAEFELCSRNLRKENDPRIVTVVFKRMSIRSDIMKRKDILKGTRYRVSPNPDLFWIKHFNDALSRNKY